MTKITVPHIPPITAATATQIEDELKNIGCHANGDARCTCVIGQDALGLIDQLRRERDAALTDLGKLRMCVICGATMPASHPRESPHPTCGAHFACTFDMTPQEAADLWRKKYHDLREATPETPTVEQAARALLDAVEAHEEVSDIVFRRMRSNFFLTTLRALAGDA